MQFSFNNFKFTVEQHLMSVLPHPNGTHATVKVLSSEHDHTVRITDNLTDSQYNFSLKPYYKRYQTGIALSFLLDEITNRVLRLTGVHVDYATFSRLLNDWQKAKPHITMSLISGRNFRHYHMSQTHPQAYLSNTDVYLLFHINVPVDSYVYSKPFSITVTNQILEKWKVNIETLITVARKNTPAAMPVEFEWLEDSLNPSVINQLGADTIKAISKTMLVVHAKNNAPNGAVTILYDDIQQRIAYILGTKNFYVIPSSIHEILCIPKSYASLDDILEQVIYISATIVDKDDFLADDVFEFDKNGILVSTIKPQLNLIKSPAYAYLHSNNT